MSGGDTSQGQKILPPLERTDTEAIQPLMDLVTGPRGRGRPADAFTSLIYGAAFDPFFIQRLQLVHILLQFEKAVPVGIVGACHHGAMASATTFMVPEMVEGDLKLIGP